MNIFQAIGLGLLQGLTEFLPVSSSGHLVIAQNILKVGEGEVLFEVILHLGTALAIIFYFRDRLVKLLQENLTLLIIGSIPAAIVGFFFQSFLEGLFDSTKVVGLALLVTAAMSYFVDKAHARREKITTLDSILIGTLQAIAIIPGISRSGATIFAGTYSGIDRKRAAEFSFLLSVPAVLGANLLELVTKGTNLTYSPSIYVLGFVVAFLSGVIAIGIVLRLLAEKRFVVFAAYSAVLGIITLLIF